MSIFPNPVAAGRSGDLDFFAACRIEDVATQIAQPDEPATFQAVYSGVFAEALEGSYTELLERVEDGEGEGEVVRPQRLRDALPDLVALRVDELGKSDGVNQVPVADLTYRPDRWFSRLTIGKTADRSAFGAPALKGDTGRARTWRMRCGAYSRASRAARKSS